MNPSQDSARRKYLNSLPPEERSEAAARYDHIAERAALDGPITDEEKRHARQSIALARRANVMIDGYEQGAINLRFEQLIARVDRGILPGHIERYIAEQLASLPAITDAEIIAAVNEDRARDRQYLKARYGL